MNKKIGIITGASSGMGRECILQLKKSSWNVDELYIIARRKDRLLEIKKEITDYIVKVIPMDISNPEERLKLKEFLQMEQPEVLFFVNCAGVGYGGSFLSLSEEEILNMLQINVLAMSALTRIILPFMSKGSHLIQFASSAAFFPQKDFAVYAASKTYVYYFSKALHREVSNHKIHVTIVCPGPVETEFLEISNKGGKQKTLKRLTTVKPRPVVKKALRDAKKGKKLSIYGLPMKLVYFLSKLVG